MSIENDNTPTGFPPLPEGMPFPWTTVTLEVSAADPDMLDSINQILTSAATGIRNLSGDSPVTIELSDNLGMTETL